MIKFKNLKIKRQIISILAGMHFFGNPSRKLKIVGVTGTNGKTTTATLLYEISTALGHKSGLIGTVENIIVDERRPALRTTPSPINLNKLLREMVDRGCEYVFMEVSSHGMDQGRVAGINFAGGIFTNLTHDHLDYHKDIESYFIAKKKFFKMLPPGAFALANIDDPYGARILEGIQAKKYTFGFKGPADFNEKLETQLLGDFNAYNALGVYAAATFLWQDKNQIKEILKNVKPPSGRFEHFTSNSGVLAIVDYAHTPDALENVLKTIQNMKKEGKVISVFGCGGDRDPMKRKVMGKIGANLSDVAIFTSDNPRSEDADKIISEMLVNLHSDEIKKVITITDRHKAIKEAVKLAQKGDIILCAGKGHENYQEIKGVKHHFDDMEELRVAFQQK